MIVIGSGPAGKRAAIQAAKIGKSVLLVEKNEVVGYRAYRDDPQQNLA
jgi:NAD(P) transhydrogenase